MDRSALPLILIELVLVFGGVLAFAWWQLRSVAHDRQKAAAERAARLHAETADPARPSAAEAQRDAGASGAGP
jgi:predicted negative regulator of RcsB-dependent stress response